MNILPRIYIIAVLITYSPLRDVIYRFSRKFYWDMNGEGNSNMMANGEFNFLRRNAAILKTYFDIGANVGDWTKEVLTLARRNSQEVTIYCFEPVRATFQALGKNIFSQSVVLENLGMGSDVGKKDILALEGRHSGLSSLYEFTDKEFARGVKIHSESVSLDTIDHYCASRNIEAIDFIKIDTEGNEVPVLRGGGGTP